MPDIIIMLHIVVKNIQKYIIEYICLCLSNISDVIIVCGVIICGTEKMQNAGTCDFIFRSE